MTATVTDPDPDPPTAAVARPVPAPRDVEPPRPEDAARPPADGGGESAARLVGVDAARGVALLGMMSVHSLYATDAAGNPTLASDIAGGRAAALFAVLAGVGVAFVTKRRRVPARRGVTTATSLLARAAMIGAFGLALGWTDPALAGVILPFYAVLFVAAVPMVFTPTPLLAVLGLGGAIGLPFASLALRAGLPPATLGNIGFVDVLTEPLTVLRELTLTGLYPAFSWLPYMAIGIVVGRLRLGSPRVAAALASGGAALAILAAAGSRLLLTLGGGAARIQADAVAQGMTPARFAEITTLGPEGTTPTTSAWWLALATAHSSTPFDLLHTIGTSVAVIGVMLLLGHVANPVLRPLVGLVQAPLSAAGSMTLTFYTAHVVFLNSDFDVYSAEVGYVLQCVVALLGGLAWRATAGRGPLERTVALVSRRAGALVGGGRPAR